jgi:RimJ/RimL family protein N-acetyltransferase
MSIFKKLTTIKTERLVIRPYKLSDLLDLHRVCCNERIGLTGGWKPHESLEESEWILRNYFMAEENRWAIVLRKTDEFVGSIGFSEDEKRRNPNVRSLGYWIAEEHWGMGYMSEAVAAVVDYAFYDKDYYFSTNLGFIDTDVLMRDVLIELLKATFLYFYLYFAE